MAHDVSVSLECFLDVRDALVDCGIWRDGNNQPVGWLDPPYLEGNAAALTQSPSRSGWICSYFGGVMSDWCFDPCEKIQGKQERGN